MILSVCPSPCIDVTSYVGELIPKALNRAHEQVTTYSGKGVNVAKGIRELGTACEVAGILPKESRGAFESDLLKRSIGCHFIESPGSARVNTKIVDANGCLTEINAKGEPVPQICRTALLTHLRTNADRFPVAVISGSLPAGCADEFYGDLSQALGTRCQKIIDTEGSKLLFALASGAALVKPNLFELEQLSQKTLRTFDEILAAAVPLLAFANAVLVSLGKDGAILTDGTRRYHAAAPVVPAGSAVGAGDGMVAAAAVALSLGAPMKDLLADAVAAGSASVLSRGTNMFSRTDFEAMRAQVTLRAL